MKKLYALLLLIVLSLTALVAGDCIANELRATRLLDPLPAGNQITFDDQGFTHLLFTITSLTLTNTGSQTITLNGSRCELTRSTLGMGTGWWDGAKNWYGEETIPGYYWYASASSAVCAMTFTSPISEFTMRLNSYDAQTPPYMDVYDADNELMTCIQLPALPGQNRWTTIGFRGKKQISRFVIRNSLIAVDNLVWSAGCPAGQTFDGSNCVDLNECDLGYCNANADCSNVNDQIICQCKSGYEGDGFGPEGCTVSPIASTPVANTPVANTPASAPVTGTPTITSPTNVTPVNTSPSPNTAPQTPFSSDTAPQTTTTTTPFSSVVSGAELLRVGIAVLLHVLMLCY